MRTFDEDFEWQERFYGHASEIVRGYYRDYFAELFARQAIDRSSIEDDWKRNTDGFVRYNKPLPDNARLSQRVRRLSYLSSHQFDQTIRLDRPSGYEAEMPKLTRGYGNIELYGFGPDDGLGADGPPLRFQQWFLGDLQILRNYLAEGGWTGPPIRNGDKSSRFTWVDLRDLPKAYVLASEGLPELEHDHSWFSCRNPIWHCSYGHRKEGWIGQSAASQCPVGADLHPYLRHGMCAGDYAVAEKLDPRMRRCLCCGYRWRSGWEPAAQTLRIERSRRVRGLLYPATP